MMKTPLILIVILEHGKFEMLNANRDDDIGSDNNTLDKNTQKQTILEQKLLSSEKFQKTIDGI